MSLHQFFSTVTIAATVVGTSTLMQCSATPAAGSAAGTVVGTAADLSRALLTPPTDGIIRLQPGNYGSLKLSAATMSSASLTLTSANPAQPAQFDDIAISGSRGLTIRDVAVKSLIDKPAVYLVTVKDATDVTLANLRVAGTGAIERGRQYGLWIRGSHNVHFMNSTISATRYGIGLLDSDHVEIVRNELHDLQTDGIRGGGVDDLLIAENVLGAFTPKEKEHPDGIQLWSNNETEPARRITIRDNLVVRDGGGITQGIFVRDTKRQLPFEDLVIHGNLLIGTMFNGIAVLGVTRGEITDNQVVAYSDMKSWVRVSGGTEVTVTNNIAAQFLLTEITKLHNRGNRSAGARRIGDVTAIAGWLRARPVLSQQAGPYLRRLAEASAR